VEDVSVAGIPYVQIYAGNIPSLQPQAATGKLKLAGVIAIRKTYLFGGSISTYQVNKA